jgi:hypothetical protein
LVPDVLKHGARHMIEGIQGRARHPHESELKRRTQPRPGAKSAP